MSSPQNKIPQLISLQASVLLLLCYIALAVIAAAALWQAQLTLLWHFSASSLLLMYSSYVILRYSLLLHPLSVVGLSYCASDDSWIAHFRNQRALPVTLSSRTIVTRHWVLLHVQSERRRYIAMVVTDSLSRDLFRQLRRHLMLG